MFESAVAEIVTLILGGTELFFRGVSPSIGSKRREATTYDNYALIEVLPLGKVSLHSLLNIP